LRGCQDHSISMTPGSSLLTKLFRLRAPSYLSRYSKRPRHHQHNNLLLHGGNTSWLQNVVCHESRYTYTDTKHTNTHIHAHTQSRTTRDNACTTQRHPAKHLRVLPPHLIQHQCQTPSDTNGQKDTSVCLFVRCVCQGRPSFGWTKRDASYKCRGVGI